MPKFSLDNPRDRALALKYIKKGFQMISRGWGSTSFPEAHLPEPLKSELKQGRSEVAEGMGKIYNVSKKIERMR